MKSGNNRWVKLALYVAVVVGAIVNIAELVDTGFVFRTEAGSPFKALVAVFAAITVFSSLALIKRLEGSKGVEKNK